MQGYLNWLLPLFYLLYFLFAFFLRSYLVWRQTGVNPYALGKSDNTHDFVGLLFRLTLIIDGLVIFLYALWPAGYAYLSPIQWLQIPNLSLLGLLLLFASLLWIIIAQIHMGTAWRIGIDEAQQSKLVQNGVFQISRNPIFLGMRVTALGLFLVLPNAVTLMTLGLSEALIMIQVRLEEEFLSKTYGAAYSEYRQKVGRWLSLPS